MQLTLTHSHSYTQIDSRLHCFYTVSSSTTTVPPSSVQLHYNGEHLVNDGDLVLTEANSGSIYGCDVTVEGDYRQPTHTTLVLGGQDIFDQYVSIAALCCDDQLILLSCKNSLAPQSSACIRSAMSCLHLLCTFNWFKIFVCLNVKYVFSC